MRTVFGGQIELPVRSKVLKRELVGIDSCPNCGSCLDRTKVCMNCREDWAALVPARYKWSPPTTRARGDD
jgi:hypothetical protein